MNDGGACCSHGHHHVTLSALDVYLPLQNEMPLGRGSRLSWVGEGETHNAGQDERTGE